MAKIRDIFGGRTKKQRFSPLRAGLAGREAAGKKKRADPGEKSKKCLTMLGELWYINKR